MRDAILHARPAAGATASVHRPADEARAAFADLERAEGALREAAAAYFAAQGPDVRAAREAYYAALTAHADAERRLALLGGGRE